VWRRVEALAVGLLVCAVFALLAWPGPSPITPENFDRLTPGMSLAEVEAILGSPGDHSTAPWDAPVEVKRIGSVMNLPPWARGRGCQHYGWYGDAAGIDLIFTQHQPPDQLIEGRLSRNTRPPQGTLDNLLWRAKRQWRRWVP
jgi:hypothetical protein